MANTLKFKRGLVATIPTAALGEPLFTTDTFDLYIGNGTGNTRFQKYIASGTTSQILRGDGSLYTFPLNISSPTNGQVLKYNGTSWVNDSDAGITGSGASGQVAYFTGATTQGGSNNLFWDNTNGRLGIGTNAPTTNLEVSGGFNVTDGTTTIRAVNSGGLGLFGTLTNHDLVLRTNNTERARIKATGNFIINNASTDNGLRFQVTGDGYFSGSVGIGTSSLTSYGLRVNKTIVGALSSTGIYQDGTVQSTVTSNVFGIYNSARTQAAAFTLSNYYHYYADQFALGAGSSITNQYGYVADSTLTGATNNYGFYGNIASGTGRWNLYMNGTAANYLRGNTAINTTTIVDNGLTINQSVNGSNILLSLRNDFGGADNEVSIKMIAGSLTAGEQGTILTHLRQGTGGGDFIIKTNSTLTGTPTEKLRVRNNGNVLINTTTDAGFRLDVNGTMRVSGASYLATSSGNVGIGTSSPASKLSVYGAGSSTGVTFTLENGGGIVALNDPLGIIDFYSNDGSLDASGVKGRISVRNAYNGAWSGVASTYNTYMAFETTNANTMSEKMRLDASGNLGLGVTPSAWTSGTYGTNTRVIEISQLGSTIGAGAGALVLSNNVYGDNTNYYYARTGFRALQYLMNTSSGAHIWYNSISGTAGNAITFTQAMTLFATGNLAVGTTTDAGFRLDVNGTMRVSGASTLKGSGNTNATAALTVQNSANANILVALDDRTVYIGSVSGSSHALEVNPTANAARIAKFGSLEFTNNGTAGWTGVGISVAGANRTLQFLPPSSSALNASDTIKTLFSAQGAAWTRTSGNAINFNIVDTQFAPTSGTATYYGLYLQGGVNQTGGANGISRGLYINYNIVAAADWRSIETTNNTGWAIYAGGTAPSFFGGAATFSSSVTGASFIPTSSTIPTNGMYLSAANTLAFATASGNKLTISSTGLATFSDSARFSNQKGCIFVQTGGSLLGSISMDSGNAITIDNNGFFGLSVGTNYTMTGGNLGIGHNSFGTSATKTISVNNGTAPSSSPVDSFQMYSNDVVAGNAAPHFRTENGAIIKLYQETTSVGNSIMSLGGGTPVLDDTTFDGYTLKQIVKALRNQGILA